MYIIVVFVLAVVSILTLHMSGGILNPSMGNVNWGISWFLDLPSILLMILFVIPILVGSGVCKDINRAFAMVIHRKKEYTLTELKHGAHAISVLMRAVLLAGLYVTVISFVVLFANIYALEGMEMGKICANIAIAILPVFYMLMIELLLLPVQASLKRRIIDFMGEV